jgi:hypothetical protein
MVIRVYFINIINLNILWGAYSHLDVSTPYNLQYIFIDPSVNTEPYIGLIFNRIQATNEHVNMKEAILFY